MPVSRKTLPRIVSQCKTGIVKQTDTSTIFRVLGVPYGGPEYLEGKDLHGEYFDRNTDFGWDKKSVEGGARTPVISRGHSFYDHAFHPKFGAEPIGTAKFYAETEEGQWWDIEVERSYRYHDFLLSLAQKGYLGASSQPIQTSVEVDFDWETGEGDGHIKRWHTAEVSLTPTPANPLAVVEIAKSFGEMFDDEALKLLGRKRSKVKTIVVEVEPPAFVDEVDAEDETEDLADVVARAFAEDDETADVEAVIETAEVPAVVDVEVEPEVEGEEPTEPVNTIAVEEEVKALRVEVGELKGLLEVLVQSLADHVKTTGERQAVLHRGVTNIQDGMKAFVETVAKSLKSTARQEALTLSDAEREAVQLLQLAALKSKTPAKPTLKSGIPDGVPGRS